MTTASGSERVATTTPEKSFSLEIGSATADVAVALQTLQERWPRTVELGSPTKSSIYHAYPRLFRAAFPAVSAERAQSLNVAASLFFDSLFVADDVMDGDSARFDVATNVVRVEAMHFESYQILHGLFAPQTRFWRRFREYLAAYAEACVDEQRLAAPAADWGALAEAAALRIARGKCSLAKIVVAGLAELAGDETPVERLVEALDCYYTARQMVDDLSDWREDVKRRCPSLLLARVAAQEFPGKATAELAGQLERTRLAIYRGGHARYILEIALRCVARAEELTSVYPDLLFRHVLGELRAHCRAAVDALDQFSRQGEAKSSQRGRRRFELTLPAPVGAWQELAWKAVELLLKRWQPAAGGVVRSAAAPRGCDVLARALVADALFDADELLAGQLRPLLEGEADFLVHQRRPGGGWGWDAIVPGLPPDADQLGKVVRVLARLGRSADLEEHCAPLLAIPLQQAVQPPDALVLAQLLSALRLYDTARFRDGIANGAAWIESRQKADGSWESPGAWGAYLPTAACAELLALERPDSPVLGKAATFLRRSQNADGGWGTAPGISDALSTALALFGLGRLQIGAGEEEDRRRARRGRERLREMAAFDAPALPGSGAVTAAFTLKAASGWHKLEAEVVREAR